MLFLVDNDTSLYFNESLKLSQYFKYFWAVHLCSFIALLYETVHGNKMNRDTDTIIIFTLLYFILPSSCHPDSVVFSKSLALL